MLRFLSMWDIATKTVRRTHITQAWTSSFLTLHRQNPPNLTTLLDPSHVTDDTWMSAYKKASTWLGLKSVANIYRSTCAPAHTEAVCKSVYTFFPSPEVISNDSHKFGPLREIKAPDRTYLTCTSRHSSLLFAQNQEWFSLICCKALRIFIKWGEKIASSSVLSQWKT